MAEEIKNLTSVVSNIEEEFESSNDIVPENVGYFSIDKRELRIGDGLTRWKDIVPFCYNEVTLDIIDDWEDRKLDNIPSSVIIHNRFVPLEESNATNTDHVNSLLSRVTNLENTRAVNNHASTKNTFGLGTSTKYGHVMVSDSVTSTSDISKGVAATPKAVKSAYDLASTASDTANAAMPKAGGTFSGAVDNTSYFSVTGTSPYYRTVTSSISRGTKPNATTTTTSYRINDSKGKILSSLRNVYSTTQDNRTDILAYTGLDDSNTASRISIGYNSSGNVYTYAPTPAVTDSSNNIATTKFVNEYVAHNQNPVGTVIMYWGNTAPSGYLICNGQAINQTTYPKLYALCGANVPDLRNYFLRGAVPGSRNTGTTETDTGRNVYGTTWIREYHGKYMGIVSYSGCITADNTGVICNPDGGADVAGSFNRRLIVDASLSWGSDHTASEFRPMNKAVLFCIKHD